ncbi:hypothetical protein [Nonomuraea sp. NPDC001023]|uniref:hypothetical protein n=1 Tax=unclassified Nonomuraea TaxID=2593643 RepID=UPI00331699EE
MFGKKKQHLQEIERDIAETRKRIAEKRGAAASAGHRTVNAINEASLRRVERGR